MSIHYSDGNDKKYAGAGSVATALALGGSSLGLQVVGPLLNALTGNVPAGHCNTGCYENQPVSQREADMAAKIAKLESEKYSDHIGQELYKELFGVIVADREKNADRFNNLERRQAEEAIAAQRMTDSVVMLDERLKCVKKELEADIGRERSERKCADTTVVNYVNATFYPRQTADITTASTTTAQNTYNPLPIECC